MKAAIVVQARFSSERLPGKVLLPLAGRPLLGLLIERLQTVGDGTRIIVATSDRPEDAAVAELARASGVDVFRGALDDVLGRLRGAFDAFALDVGVRVSGDSPLIDPRLVSRALGLFRAGDADLVTNVQVRTYPKGQSVEAIGAAALRRADADARTPAEREHVTPYFYAHPDRFRIRNFAFDPPVPALQLSIDTAEDFAIVERMLQAMSRPHTEYDVAALVALHREVIAR
jgi:spore coat polysaccharide biosynthesis protein SpsF